MPLFVISLKIFIKPLITSCQIHHPRKICHCPKNRQLSTFPSLSSHLNIWPNPWWIFGALAIFVEICLLSIFPSLPPHLRFCQLVDGFLLNSLFSQICHFLWKSPTVNMPVLLSHCLNPCQIRRFCKICQFDSLLFEYGNFVSYITSLLESRIETEVNTVQLH